MLHPVLHEATLHLSQRELPERSDWVRAGSRRDNETLRLAQLHYAWYGDQAAHWASEETQFDDRCICSRKLQGRRWGPLTVVLNGYRGDLAAIKGRWRSCPVAFHLVSGFRMSGDLPPFSLYAFMFWTVTALLYLTELLWIDIGKPRTMLTISDLVFEGRKQGFPYTQQD